ncbi:hypothetical protein EG327_007089 [Venturia inaequalis]|uniref:Uncharacterized protein n=1 Tax=Venturia inaequalis TaxID=5025 RepID=A0A8H3VRX2_VENIN|nr:hypothetical protein EG327_007089 [Venturia inaequalis]
MPFLSDLPNEILDELMGRILDISPASQLQAFLFSRQFNPSAVRAIYLNVRFMVNSDSQMEILEDAKDEKKTAIFRNNLLAFDLLARTSLESSHLFENTRTVQLRIFDTYSKAHSADIETRGLNFSGLHGSDPKFAAIWAESVNQVLSAVTAVEDLVCDWFMDMDGVPAKIQQLSRLRTLQIRGIKYVSERPSDTLMLPDDLVLPAGLENLHLSLLKFDPELNFKMAGTSDTTPAQLKLETIDCRPYRSQLEPESASVDDLVTPTSTTTRARYTEIRIVFDEFCLDANMDVVLDQSFDTLETLEFLDNCKCGPGPAAQFYQTWTRLTKLNQLNVSMWNVPDLSVASECRLEELTHLQLNIAQEEFTTFSVRFEETLHRIEEGRLFPKLESIKLSMRRSHWTPDEDDSRKWSSLRRFIQQEWSNKRSSEFCGWEKAPYSVEDAADHASGIYQFANGIILDICDILAVAEYLEQHLKKRTSLSGRLTYAESMKMAMSLI